MNFLNNKTTSPTEKLPRRERKKRKKKQRRKLKRIANAIKEKEIEAKLENSLFSTVEYLKKKEAEEKKITTFNTLHDFQRNRGLNTKDERYNQMREKLKLAMEKIDMKHQTKKIKINTPNHINPINTIERNSTPKQNTIITTKPTDFKKLGECVGFSKLGCCKDGADCNRRHKYPPFSTIILFSNMYKDGDPSNKDVDDPFDYFFRDVTSEFEKFAKIKRFYVSRNHMLHLNGNLYVEFYNEKDAIKICKNFYGRWFSCYQLFPSFIKLKYGWSSVICDDYHKRNGRCNGDCNCLHVYMNPKYRYQPEFG